MSPERRVVCLISFEGPDRYALAGGLGVRVSDLARALAQAGHEVHLYFVGDPDLPGEEDWCGVRLHRWGQWLSRYHRAGVYDGEEAKLADMAASLPPHLLAERVRPAVAAGRSVVVLAEEWQTAPTVTALSDLLHSAGLRRQVDILWNANNPMGFERIDWPRLGFVAALTTVSRYMKHVMWGYGVNPIVIPNGLAPEWLGPPDDGRAEVIRQAFAGELLLVKVGRFDPDKRWLMAVQAAAQLKALGARPRLVMRGGIEPHGGEVLAEAFRRGLTVADVEAPRDAAPDQALEALLRSPRADVLNLRFFLPAPLLKALYRAADAVLANSGMEPFGLVGLEVMASGGVAFVGATGEDYARHFENAIVLETDDPGEIVTYLAELRREPELAERIRAEGRATAELYRWERILKQLEGRLRYLRQRAGAAALSWPESR